MHQILVSPMTANPATLQPTSNGKRVHWTDSVSVQVLRQDAASLRAVAQAHMTKAGTSTTSNHPADLLQQAAILDTAADVLALTDWT